MAFNFNNKESKDNMGNNSIGQQMSAHQSPIEPPHAMLNNTTIIQNDGKMLLKSEWPFYSKDLFQAWKTRYHAFLFKIFGNDNYTNIKNPMIQHLMIPVSYEYTNINICSPTGIVTMLYETANKTLVTDIEEKSIKNQPYLESELWILIHLLSKIVNFLHDKAVAVGDVRSQNIFIDFRQRKVKVAVLFSWIGQLKFVHKVQTDPSVLVSPQLLDCKNKNKEITEEMLMINDDFLIGMTIAECILLQDLSKIYTFEGKFRILSKSKLMLVIEKLLKVKYYSFKLLLIIIGMIQYKPKQRITSLQVCYLLQDCQHDIMKGDTFLLTKEYFLQKIHQKYSILEDLINSFKTKGTKFRIETKTETKEMTPYKPFIINDISTIPHKNNQETSNTEFISDFTLGSSLRPFLKQSQMTSPLVQQPCQNTEQNHFPIHVQKKEKRVNFIYRQSQTPVKSSQRGSKKLQHLKLSEIKAVSDIKELNNFIKPQFISKSSRQHQESSKSLEAYKIIEPGKTNEQFSFHSPDSRLKESEKYAEEEEQEKCEQASVSSAIHRLERSSIAKSTETLLLMPSVYAVSNAPQSYISYHYTKSIAPKQKKDRDECDSFETKCFQFQRELPQPSNIRKKSEQTYEVQDRFEIKQASNYKRRTLGYNQLKKKEFGCQF